AGVRSFRWSSTRTSRTTSSLRLSSTRSRPNSSAHRARARPASRSSWRSAGSRPPSTLYPEGAPARGAAIDVSAHLARFPDGALILTTGADSTHAWTGRSIALGPGPDTRHTLAHELAHLLGFRDAYLRGYDGDPRGPY